MYSVKQQVWILVLGSMLLQPAFAKDDDSAAAKAALQGGVKGTTITLPVFLKELGDNCHHIFNASKVLLYETQRQDTVAVGGPNLIGDMVIPAVPSPSGIVTMGGFLPPRKKWLDFFTNQIQQLINMTQLELGELEPQKLTSDEDASMTQLRNQITQLASAQNGLTASIQGPKYDNEKIGQQVSLIQEQVKEIDKTRKSLSHLIRKSG